jgi:hypothetical protein
MLGTLSPFSAGFCCRFSSAVIQPNESVNTNANRRGMIVYRHGGAKIEIRSEMPVAALIAAFK